MNKTFYIIAGIALTGCIYFECTPEYNSQTVAGQQYDQQPTEQPEAYHITLHNDSIQVIDPTNGKVIYKEAGNAKSGISEAIIKDNE